MKKLPRPIYIEFVWLLVSLGITALLSFLLLGKRLLSGTVDIHVHDTYYVIKPLHVFVPIFLFLTFVVYFIKEFLFQFRRTFPNWILVVVGFVLVIVLTFLIHSFSKVDTAGWTIYPPLSSLGEIHVTELTDNPVTKFITNGFTVIQVIILVCLLFVVFRWGTQRQPK